MTNNLEAIKKADHILEKRICRLMIKKEEAQKDLEMISKEMSDLMLQSDELYRQIEKLEAQENKNGFKPRI